MSDLKKREPLSPAAKKRKQEMLGELQGELAGVHQRRRTTAAAFKVAAVGAILVLAGLVWLRLPGDEQVPSGSGTIARQSNPDQASPDANPKWSFVSVARNRDGVDDRYVVANVENPPEIESIDDDELLAMLAATGRPAVLGTINGKTVVIPDRGPL